MDSRDFEAAQRTREAFAELRLLPGAWPVVRVDGRSFSRFTEGHFDKPFDARFSDHMVAAAEALVTELQGLYAYTESDEISVLLPPDWQMFGRRQEKVVSVSAGVASAAFVLSSGLAAHFDARVWLGTNVDAVVDYFSWRQADATRCALNGWCYWTLRRQGHTASQATRKLDGTGTPAKNELLHGLGINFNDTPAWQRRGIALWRQEETITGTNPLTSQSAPVTRRRITIDRDLPHGEAYRQLLRDHLRPGGGPTP